MKALIGRIPKPAMAGLALVLVAAVAVTAYAATEGGSSPSAASGPDQAAMQEFQQCLSEHGVTPPQGAGAPPSGAPPTGQAPSGQPAPGAKLQQAFQACRQYAPAGGPLSGAPPSGAPPGGLPVPSPGS